MRDGNGSHMSEAVAQVQAAVPGPAPLTHQRGVQAFPAQERPALPGSQSLLVAGQQVQLLRGGERSAWAWPTRAGTLLTAHQPILEPDGAIDDSGNAHVPRS
jgi:hypothetical protein